MYVRPWFKNGDNKKYDGTSEIWKPKEKSCFDDIFQAELGRIEKEDVESEKENNH